MSVAGAASKLGVESAERQPGCGSWCLSFSCKSVSPSLRNSPRRTTGHFCLLSRNNQGGRQGKRSSLPGGDAEAPFHPGPPTRRLPCTGSEDGKPGKGLREAGTLLSCFRADS